MHSAQPRDGNISVRGDVAKSLQLGLLAIPLDHTMGRDASANEAYRAETFAAEPQPECKHVTLLDFHRRHTTSERTGGRW